MRRVKDMIEIKEITVGDAFRHSYGEPPLFDTSKTTTCPNCLKEIESLYMVNETWGLCKCGNILFDWRPKANQCTVKTKDDLEVLKEACRYLLILSPKFKCNQGIPIALVKNIKAIDETIVALKLLRKMKQGKTIRSRKGLTNKIKYYFFGYVLVDAVLKTPTLFSCA